jgi:tetratricopeptide (TPR) repeat protein
VRRLLGTALVCLTLACAAARQEQRPAPEPGPSQVPSEQSAEALLEEARSAFALRPDAEAVRRAEALYLAAAQADPEGVEGLYGAMLARVWRVEHTQDASARDALAGSAVDAGRQCLERAPDHVACHFGLAQALGVQARERLATALVLVREMVAHLRRAAELDPRFEQGGPARVLSVVLVRAPGWPVGPGDAEQGLEEARKAVALSPEYPPNLLALSDALLANDEVAESRTWAERALALARDAQARGEPDAPSWVRQAEQLLAGERSLPG